MSAIPLPISSRSGGGSFSENCGTKTAGSSAYKETLREAHPATQAPSEDSSDLGTRADEELVSLAQNGVGAAFDELVRRYHRECMKRALHIMGNHSDAEDQVQNACWKAFASIHQFRGEGRFGAWLSRIVENQCLMTFRRPRRDFMCLEDPTDKHGGLELVCQDMNPEDRVGREEVIGVLRTEVTRLPPIMRDMVLLCDLKEKPLPEVAALLRISIPAAKSRLARARSELRSRISKHAGRRGFSILTLRATYSETAYGPSCATFSSAA